jgi:hypothetical protein
MHSWHIPWSHLQEVIADFHNQHTRGLRQLVPCELDWLATTQFTPPHYPFIHEMCVFFLLSFLSMLLL